MVRQRLFALRAVPADIETADLFPGRRGSVVTQLTRQSRVEFFRDLGGADRCTYLRESGAASSDGDRFLGESTPSRDQASSAREPSVAKWIDHRPAVSISSPRVPHHEPRRRGPLIKSKSTRTLSLSPTRPSPAATSRTGNVLRNSANCSSVAITKNGRPTGQSSMGA